MKKSFLFLTGAVLALAFAGCTKDATDNEMPAPQGVLRTVGANIEELTRTSMDDFEAGGTSRLVWSDGDAIGLVTEDGTIRKATIQAEYVGRPYAEFDVEGAAAGETYEFAFYPYAYYGATATTATVQNGTLSLTLPARQRFVHDGSKLVDGKTFQTRMNTMAAKPDGEGTMHFKSLCGIIEVRLKGSSALWNATLQSDKSKLAGLATVDMKADEPVLVMADSNKAFHSTYMVGSDIANKGIKLGSEPVSLFFLVPAGTYDDLRIATSSTYGTQLVSKRSHTVKPNTILALPAYNCDSQDADLYEEGMYTDLSVDAEGNPAYSNCYLVQPSDTPKAYRIKACYNDGTTVLKYPDGTTIQTLGNQNAAYCLWESENGMVSHVRRAGGYIYFTLSGKSGNAFIQTASTTLSAIVGWHIWISDVKDQTLPGGHVFMDRNLGATYSPATLAEAEAMNDEQKVGVAGMLYQWGSPTPKRGLNAVTATSSADNIWSANKTVLHKWSNGEYGQTWNASGSTSANLYNAFTYANYFYGQSGWWANGKEKLFGNQALWQSKKTMFDPCPVGYRVASRSEFGKAFANEVDNYKGKIYTGSRAARGSYITLDNNFVFIPWVGLRKTNGEFANANAGETSGAYARAHYWFFDEEYTAATMSGTILYGTTGTAVSSGQTPEQYARSYKLFILYGNDKGKVNQANLYKYAGCAFVGNGFSLRCVKIQNTETTE